MKEKNSRPFRPENTFGHKFRVMHNTIEKILDHRHEKTGERLTGVQCATLHFLMKHRDQDVFQKDIEAVFSISGATATNILKGLEKKELICRIPTERDARLKKITMTEKAIINDQYMRKGVEHMEAAIVRGMSQEEITIFSDLLDRAILNLEALRKEEEL